MKFLWIVLFRLIQYLGAAVIFGGFIICKLMNPMIGLIGVLVGIAIVCSIAKAEYEKFK